MTFAEAARIMMSGGGNEVNKFDRIARLPTLFSFDLANGWWGEVCEDSSPYDQPVGYGVRDYDNWDEEYTDTYVCSKVLKSRYLRIFKGTELQLVSDVVGESDGCGEWYAANVNGIGGLKKTITNKCVYTGRISSVGPYNPEHVHVPSVYFEGKYTSTENGIIIYEDTIAKALISEYTKFIYKNFDDINLSAHYEFAKAVCKFSDVYNGTTISK